MTDLSRRALDLSELMDDPGCDPVALDRTYARFRVLNALVARWGAVYRHRLRPLLDPHRTTTVLDVGSGGGDVARSLLRWARRDGLRLRVTAADPDPRAFAFATRPPAPPGLEVLRCTTGDLRAEGRRFDVVVSNHLLHHLDEAGLTDLLDDSRALAERLVLHSDLARSRVSYAAYGLVSLPLATRTFVRVDGLRSIRRSHTAAELRTLAPPPWRVETQVPYRLLLSWQAGRG